MTRKINAVTARTQFGRVMDRAVDHNERFLIERNGEPAILILTVADFVRTLAPPPGWIQKAWDHSKRHGPDRLILEDTNAEIAATRRERRQRHVRPGA